ncbi:site-2 protease family protein [Alteribacillus sp. HJP-4]|uniref:site-2 protease family protein n=1 Tax=Alteribacillus sp. HJP-4 TaxID=2775394 RepID=UPI0035CD0570
MISAVRLIKIHPLFWLVCALSLFTSYFYEMLMLFSIVFLHELGHYVAARSFQWRIEHIKILPFGGVMETKEHGSRPAAEEALVAIAGPAVHVPLCLLSFLLLQTPWWSNADHESFFYCNLLLFCFNLLPVWPLDGGKLLLCLYSLMLPFKQAQKYSWMTSFLLLQTGALFLIIFYPFHLQAWLLYGFFLLAHRTEWKQMPYSYFRFLLARTELARLPGKSYKESISWHARPVDAAKKLRKHGEITFHIIENGQILPESYILEAITKNNQGMLPLREWCLK